MSTIMNTITNIESFRTYLKDVMKNNMNTQFILIINNVVIRESGYYGSAFLNEEGELILGIKQEGEIRESEGVIQSIARQIFRDRFHNLDLTNTSSAQNRRVKVEVDVPMRVISILTSTYAQALKILESNYDEITYNDVVNGTSIAFDAGNMYQYRMQMTVEMFEKYSEMERVFLDQRFKKKNVLKFYRTDKAFVPVFYSGKFIYNPFEKIPTLRKQFEQTRLYQLMEENPPEIVNDIRISFLTHREICECFTLTRFLRFNFSLVNQLLMDNFVNGFLDKNELMYIYTGDVAGRQPILSVDEYTALEYKEGYVEANRFSFFCLQNSVAINGKKVPQGLYLEELRDSVLATRKI